MNDLIPRPAGQLIRTDSCINRGFGIQIGQATVGCRNPDDLRNGISELAKALLGLLSHLRSLRILTGTRKPPGRNATERRRVWATWGCSSVGPSILTNSPIETLSPDGSSMPSIIAGGAGFSPLLVSRTWWARRQKNRSHPACATRILRLDRDQQQTR